MRFCKLLLLLVLFSVHAGYAQHAPLTISKAAPGCFVYTTYHDVDGQPFPSNSMYVVTKKGVIMIDVPWDTTQVDPLLDSIQARHHQKVILCIATHFHEDRTGALDILKRKGIATYSSFQTLQLCKERHEQRAQFFFTKDTVFRLGNTILETYYPGAGHAPDNILIWLPQQQLLYGGCFIKSTESKGLGNLSDADPTAWRKNVIKVMHKYPHPKYIITGHQDWSSRNSLQHTLTLLKSAS